MRSILTTVATTLLLAVPAEAQYRQAARFSPAAAPHRATVAPLAIDPSGHPARTELLVAAGVVSAATGFIGGALVGAEVESEFFPCTCDDPGLTGALLGAAVGPALLTPLAVNWANDGRGSLSSEYGAAALIAGLGFVALLGPPLPAGSSVSVPVGPILFLAMPVAQVASAVLIERGTSR